MGKRTVGRVKGDQVPLLSGGVAFFGLLALVPALAALVSIYGLVAEPEDIESNVEDLGDALPTQARELLVDQLERIAEGSGGGLGLAAVGGLLLALWSASSGLNQLIAALNVAYGETDERGFLRTRGLALGLTVGAVAFLVATFVAVALLPTLLSGTGMGDAAQGVANAARWPLLAVLVLAALAVVYRLGPDREAPRWQWVSPGAAAATGVWLLASLGFSVYASTLGSYNETYGSLGAVVVLMLWLFLTAFAILLGAELNAEAERQTAVDTTTGPSEPLGQRGAAVADEPPPDAGADTSTG